MDIKTANARLHQLRAQVQARRKQQRIEPDSERMGHRRLESAGEVSIAHLQEAVLDLPDYVGRGDNLYTAIRNGEASRQERSRLDAPTREDTVAWLAEVEAQVTRVEVKRTLPTTVKLYPTLAHTLLKKELVAPARVWLLLRCFDEVGRGWIELGEARQLLTAADSPWRICGQRQLRNLWHLGEGIFWERDGDKVWLRSMKRVAAAVGVEKLIGQPVMIPVKALLGRIGTVRAHFYASFHSSRCTDAPISRATLQDLSGVCAESQRTYEKQVGVQVKKNVAIGAPVHGSDEKEVAWQCGRALFKIVDETGWLGKVKQAYFAWRLPNSYQGPHKLASRGQQYRCNMYLSQLVGTVLFDKGMTGNGREDENQDTIQRCYFARSGTAVKTWSPDRKTAIYWRDYGLKRDGRWRAILPLAK